MGIHLQTSAHTSRESWAVTQRQQDGSKPYLHKTALWSSIKCMYLVADCEDLINTDSPRITQLSLVKPEYNLTETFNIAMSFERGKFEQSPDRVGYLHESWFES